MMPRNSLKLMTITKRQPNVNVVEFMQKNDLKAWE